MSAQKPETYSSDEEEGQIVGEEVNSYKDHQSIKYGKRDKYGDERRKTRGGSNDDNNLADDGYNDVGHRSSYNDYDSYKSSHRSSGSNKSRHSNRDYYSSKRRRDDDGDGGYDGGNNYRSNNGNDGDRYSRSSRSRRYDDGDRYSSRTSDLYDSGTRKYNYDLPLSTKYSSTSTSTSSSRHHHHRSNQRDNYRSRSQYDQDVHKSSKSRSRSPSNNQDLRSIIDRKSRKRDVIEEDDDEYKTSKSRKDNQSSAIEVEEVEMSDEELRRSIDDEGYRKLIKGDADDVIKIHEDEQLSNKRSIERVDLEEEDIDSVDSKEANDGSSRRSKSKDEENKSQNNSPTKESIKQTTTFTPLNSPRPTTTDRQVVDVETDQEMEAINYYPSFQGCRSVEEFQCINRIEEGTYGVVYRAKCKVTNQIVALKRLKMEKEKEGFPITSLREINTLLKSSHQNIVGVLEIVVGSSMDKIFIVMEYVEHDLKSLMETMKTPFLIGEVKTLLKQLLSAIAHLHDNWILHRDLKTSNLLLNHKGILKVGDFGLAREYGSPLKPYTPVVVTLWYRAPELLLDNNPKYSTPIDVWSIGCIFAELVIMKPFFPGKSELNQLELIYKDLGTPNDKIWPGYSSFDIVKKIALPEIEYNSVHERFKGNKLSKNGLDLLIRLLTYCPEKRVTALGALDHSFFSESPRPIDPSLFPSWPAKSEGGSGHPVRRVHDSPKAPVGGQVADSVAGENDDVLMEGFHLKGIPAATAGFSLRF